METTSLFQLNQNATKGDVQWKKPANLWQDDVGTCCSKRGGGDASRQSTIEESLKRYDALEGIPICRGRGRCTGTLLQLTLVQRIESQNQFRSTKLLPRIISRP